MFGAIKGYFFGDNNSVQTSNNLKENKPLKSDVSNNNLEKKTIIKGEKNKFDFSEEYDEDEPKQLPKSSTTSDNSSDNDINNVINEGELNNIYKTDDMDYWRMAHCVYVKNSLININTLNYVPFVKRKKNSEGILSYIGLGNDPSYNEIKYLAGFDEHFIYMINLSKEENKNEKDSMKTIGNHYDITKISNIEIDTFQNKILITILFVLDNDVDNFISKIKKFYLDRRGALKFLKLLQIYLNNYKINIMYNDKVFGNIKFNENKEEKKEGKENKNEEKKEKEKEEEKIDENNKIGEEEKEDKSKEDNKNDEEIFTDENVTEKTNEKENKNLIDI
jgi:hypothetical protein